jgi:peptide chain release factor 1
LNKERRSLEDILESGRKYRQVKIGIDEANEIIKANEDAELVEMATEELEEFKSQFENLETEFQLKLIPRDPNDDKAAIVEVRAGTGGDEAGIFVGDIFRMIQKYADSKKWKLDIINSSAAQAGGFKEIIFSVEGEGAYGMMKYESGVHRVQRVPVTETQGRVHTSAVTVAVFPEAEDVDLNIQDNEIKVDVYRSSGPGGQSVNTTDSAVRLTYLPTGLVVTCQDEKSQHKNKAKALRVLRARLYELEEQKRQAERAEARRNQVGSGDRSERIRTYNFPQNRITDHRINLTLYKLDSVIEGNITQIVDSLKLTAREQYLKAELS